MLYMIWILYENCGPDHRVGSLEKEPAIVPRGYICGWVFYAGFEFLVEKIC